MFRILYQGELIGSCEFECGDGPMGGAEGVFTPLDKFARFQSSVCPETDGDPAITRWCGLSVQTSDGEELACLDVVLHLYHLETEVALVAGIIGLGYPKYEEVFPEHVRAYNAQFS